MSLYGNFKFKLKVPEYKVELSKKYKVYIERKTEIELAISKFNNVHGRMLQRFYLEETFDAVLLRETLKEAFEEMVDATSKLNFMTRKAKLILEHKLASIEVNLGQSF